MVQFVRVLSLLPVSLALFGCSGAGGPGTTETLSTSTTSPTTGASEGAPTTDLSDSCIGTPCTTEPNDDDGDNRDCGSGGPNGIEFCSNETGKCEAL